MKKELEEWKRQNGNVTYTTKELIQGIHIKVDGLDKKMSEQFGTCSGRFISKTTFWSVIGLVTTFAGAVFAAIVKIFKG